MTLNEIEVKDIEISALLTPIQKAILRAGIKILDADGVAEYKAQKLAQLRAKAERRNPKFLAIAGALFILAIVFIGYISPRWGWFSNFLACASGAVTCAAAIACYFTEPRDPHALKNLAWRTYFVGSCHKGRKVMQRRFNITGTDDMVKIPEPARDIFRKLAATGVTANAWVDQLDTDPFLRICNTDGEEFFVYAWDEDNYIPR